MSITHTNDKRQEAETHIKKKQSFNRNPSLEKIIKFNAYICSQNFFILPAILAWLRTSQSVLQSYSEKCSAFVKILTVKAVRTTEGIYRNPLKSYTPKSEQKPSRELNRKLLEVLTYGCLTLVFLELTACVVCLSTNSMPGGLIFMLVSICYISYMNYLCLRLVLLKQKHKKEHEKDFENEATTRYIRPKDILGKRTISSLNLF